MMRFAVAGVLALTLSFAAAQASETAQPMAAAGCSGYTEYVQVARERLEQGDRPGALAALKQARTALAACLRDTTDETVLGSTLPQSNAV